MASVISRPISGSAIGKPAPTPSAPTSTASEVRPSTRACMAVGHEAGAADALAHTNAVDRHGLVADEPDDGRCHDPTEVSDRLRG